jgi:hypothetical protein
MAGSIPKERGDGDRDKSPAEVICLRHQREGDQSAGEYRQEDADPAQASLKVSARVASRLQNSVARI